VLSDAAVGAERTARQFFALACQHTRWELNDLARRLDEWPAAVELCDESAPAPASSASGLTPDGRRILAAIDRLPEGEREAFDLVRIRGMSQEPRNLGMRRPIRGEFGTPSLGRVVRA
jgi:DNA-directed RNA polymerase specialized sigma24 family protein